jgi:hypothetical protein
MATPESRRPAMEPDLLPSLGSRLVSLPWLCMLSFSALLWIAIIVGIRDLVR